jgi:hypothetical protein
MPRGQHLDDPVTNHMARLLHEHARRHHNVASHRHAKHHQEDGVQHGRHGEVRVVGDRASAASTIHGCAADGSHHGIRERTGFDDGDRCKWQRGDDKRETLGARGYI